MRLIDADKLIANIEAMKKYHQDADDIIEMIDNMDADYNVDNVVEQLEENQNWESYFDGDIFYIQPKGILNLDTVIKIVRKGGVE